MDRDFEASMRQLAEDVDLRVYYEKWDRDAEFEDDRARWAARYKCEAVWCCHSCGFIPITDVLCDECGAQFPYHWQCPCKEEVEASMRKLAEDVDLRVYYEKWDRDAEFEDDRARWAARYKCEAVWCCHSCGFIPITDVLCDECGAQFSYHWECVCKEE